MENEITFTYDMPVVGPVTAEVEGRAVWSGDAMPEIFLYYYVKIVRSKGWERSEHLVSVQDDIYGAITEMLSKKYPEQWGEAWKAGLYGARQRAKEVARAE